MLTPMRSLTLSRGFWLSSFATTSATQPCVTLFSRTNGVLPINSVTSFAIFMSASLVQNSRCGNTTKMVDIVGVYEKGRGRSPSLSVGQPVTDRASGRADIYEGDPALEPVVTCLVEEIADRYNSRGFSDKVNSQSRSGAPQELNDRVQFPSSALQIGASDSKVGSVQSGSREEQHLVLAIPELVFAGYRLRQRDKR